MFDETATLTFDLLTSELTHASMAGMHYTSTKFGVDSSRRFPLRARTHRLTHEQTQTDIYATDHPSHALATLPELVTIIS